MRNVNRSQQRWVAFARSTWRRIGTQLRSALFTDTPAATETIEGERAGAREFARRAAALRGGMAKVAQLQAYLEGPGQATDSEARASLAVLWDHAPGDEPAAIRRVIEEDLGAPPERLFASWQERPLAAASLGQVHAATLADGTRLAVKVQYPAVAEGLRDDLASGSLVRLLAGAELGGGLSTEAIAALRDSLLAELDYVAEARNLTRFHDAYAGDPTIVIPRPHPTLSSARVLTMDLLEGRPLATLATAGTLAQRNAVALTLFRFAWGAPLLHHMLNADPNPGNYLVLDAPDAQAGRVGFLDFGCAESIAPDLAAADHDLWYAIILRDGERFRHAVHRQRLLSSPRVLDTSTFRDWEEKLAAPFLASGDHAITAADVRELARLTSKLVRAGGMNLPPGVLLLWRQRLGALSVIATLRPRLDFRAALAALLDDGQHPTPLIRRYP